MLKLQEEGFDVTLRLSPLIEEYLNFDYLNGLLVNKFGVEFLQVPLTVCEDPTEHYKYWK
ncbi:hypothetical protein [Coprococcus phoceensis]|uniref:hypothetical protein n=1 Tax=Coprococcus phoceensis TaxID=1870993 RepID=UPI001F403516|nr:hypothetical protein [Coprococcus phoceensis]